MTLRANIFSHLTALDFISVSKDLFCTFKFKYVFPIHFDLKMTLSKRPNVVAFISFQNVLSSF